MKLSFLKNITVHNEHAVRLSDFNSLQANLFRETINRLITAKENPIDLTTQDFIQSYNCRLTLRVGEEDLGITTEDYKNFFCDLTIGNYKNMMHLLGPFCIKESKGYEWLYDIDNPIDFLFSSGGTVPPKIV
jgi:hypothetical protein